MDKQAGPVMLDYQGKVELIKVDVNDAANQELLRQYPVSYVPASFIMDKEGELSYSFIGLLEPEEIRAELDKVVSD